ncbi:MAG: YidC/Oxa1 family membrane protein insertase [Candidatus Dojkabacteria bacterium]|jgi:YidC/Oxa1 family membrane protein insertase|nr:YidC/Oxa1 family membrane protein insertase [Candidatus Dojkabacteria bacterium]
MLGIIWNNIVYYPILNLLLAFYALFGNNLGLAIIAIAIVFRLLLIPLMNKQREMTKKMASLKPQLDQIQKKYKNNPEKLSQEQVKLYKKVGYNPLGCFVTFLPQLIILSVLIQVIRNVTGGTLDGIYPFMESWLNGGASLSINTQFLIWDLTKSYNDIAAEVGKFAPLSLGYFLLSFLVGVSQYFASKFTQTLQNPAGLTETKKKAKNEELSAEEMQKKMSGSFMYILPLSTIFITISAPAALSLYWVIQSFMLVFQYLLMDKEKSKEAFKKTLSKLKTKKK